MDLLRLPPSPALAFAEDPPPRSGLRQGHRLPLPYRAGLVPPAWGKATLRALAGWRYASAGRWDKPWELDLARKVIPLREPQRESL